MGFPKGNLVNYSAHALYYSQRDPSNSKDSFPETETNEKVDKLHYSELLIMIYYTSLVFRLICLLSDKGAAEVYVRTSCSQESQNGG